MKEAASPPEGVPRLIDLVKPQHAELLPAFYFALRNTVVAKDLDQVGPTPGPIPAPVLTARTCYPCCRRVRASRTARTSGSAGW